MRAKWFGLWPVILLVVSQVIAAPEFPPTLPTPCDGLGNLDKRPGFKREGRQVSFQWIAAQAQVSANQWCKYYAVKNLHSSASLSFRWPTTNIEHALLDPNGIVDVMTNPARPNPPKDNDPIYYGAISPGPLVMVTVFQAQLSAADYPGRTAMTVRGRGIGGRGGQDPGINLSGLEFSSTIEGIGPAALRYSIGYKVISADYEGTASISWWPSETSQFFNAVKAQHPDVRFGSPVPLKSSEILASYSGRQRAEVKLVPARIFKGGRLVLVINVPILVPGR